MTQISPMTKSSPMTLTSSPARPGVRGRIGDTFAQLRSCRLCWRITIAIFAAILATEGAILFFSIQNFERDRLHEVERESLIVARAILREAKLQDDFAAGVSELGPRLRDTSVLLGMNVLDKNGTTIARFGVAPDPDLAVTPDMSTTRYLRSTDGLALNLAWPARRTRSDHMVVARIDTTEIAPRSPLSSGASWASSC
jgi:hypothetical protein